MDAGNAVGKPAQADEAVRAAGVICREPSGKVLMLRRVDTGEWSWPGGCIEGDETPEQAAMREVVEETGYHLGRIKHLMQRVKDDGHGLVDFTTFVADVDEPFVPKLNGEHNSFGWFDPLTALDETEDADVVALADPESELELAAQIADSLDLLEQRVAQAEASLRS